MGAQSRNQEYTYQYKTVCIANQSFCGYGPNLQINLPDNILAVKSLYIKLVVQFDAAETNKTIPTIFLNGLPSFSYFYSGTTTLLSVNWQANASNILTGRIDLSGQLGKLHIFPGGAGNQPFIVLAFGNNNKIYSSSTNLITLWKTDLTYTTQGIR